MSQHEALRISSAAESAGSMERDENYSECMSELEHALSVFRQEGTHGEIKVTIVDGEADRMSRTTSIKFQRGKRKPPPA